MTTENTDLLFEAAENGNFKEVLRLIPISDPKYNDSLALQVAASYGNTECLKMLLPVSDAKANNSYALQAAVRNGHTACIELLYCVSDPQAALDQLKCDHPEDIKMWGALERRIARAQNQRLNAEIEGTARSALQRKI